MPPQSASDPGVYRPTPRTGRRCVAVAGALLVLVGAAAVAIYAGIYNIAADVPHTQPVYWLLETLRDRSVATRARNVAVPNDLEDANRVASSHSHDLFSRGIAPGEAMALG
jgi:hypothetical protein